MAPQEHRDVISAPFRVIDDGIERLIDVVEDAVFGNDKLEDNSRRNQRKLTTRTLAPKILAKDATEFVVVKPQLLSAETIEI